PVRPRARSAPGRGEGGRAQGRQVKGEGGLPKRPLSVLLLQIAVGISFIYFAGVLAMYLFRAAWILNHDPLAFMVFLMTRGALLGYVGFVFYALYRRRGYARWLGLTCILALLVVSIYEQVGPVNPELATETPGFRVGHALGGLIGVALTAWWLFSFGF